MSGWPLWSALTGSLAVVACYLSSGEPEVDAGTPDGTDLDAGGCVRQLPDCPEGGAPSYQNEISGIVQAKCAACHYPGNPFSPFVLTTYPDIYGNRGSTLNQVYACLMPLADAAALTATERTDVLTWLVCGSPNN